MALNISEGVQGLIYFHRTPLKSAVQGASSGSLGEYREKMNGLLQAVLSSTYQAPSHPAILRDSLVSLARYGRALEEILPEEMWVSTPVPSKYEPPPPIITHGGHAPSTDEDEESGSEEVDDEDIEVVPDHLLSPLFLQPGEDHFFGPSSGLRLLATALEFKEEYHRNPHALKLVFEKYKRPHFWALHPVRSSPDVACLPLTTMTVGGCIPSKTSRTTVSRR
jgi:hypothetical protein